MRTLYIEDIEDSSQITNSDRFWLRNPDCKLWHFWQYLVSVRKCPVGAYWCEFLHNPNVWCEFGPSGVSVNMGGWLVSPATANNHPYFHQWARLWSMSRLSKVHQSHRKFAPKCTKKAKNLHHWGKNCTKENHHNKASTKKMVGLLYL